MPTADMRWLDARRGPSASRRPGPEGRPDDDHAALPEWGCLSEDERTRGLRFVRPRDRRRFIICRGSLRMILGRLLAIPPERVAFRPGPGGKPELAPDRRARRPAAPAVQRDALRRPGPDRRQPGSGARRRPRAERAISEADRIVESYFTAAELAQYRRPRPAAQAAAFLRGWTRKEAILKAKGVGLAGLACRFETMFGTSPLGPGFTPAPPPSPGRQWWLWEAAAARFVMSRPSPSTAQGTGTDPALRTGSASELSLRAPAGAP